MYVLDNSRSPGDCFYECREHSSVQLLHTRREPMDPSSTHSSAQSSELSLVPGFIPSTHQKLLCRRNRSIESGLKDGRLPRTRCTPSRHRRGRSTPRSHVALQPNRHQPSSMPLNITRWCCRSPGVALCGLLTYTEYPALNPSA